MENSFGRPFGSVLHVCASYRVFEFLLTSFPGHYRLWVNGIHHGDISYKNLMYDISGTEEPIGILNDFDLATWVDHPTANNDRTGTIPFMAIDLLEGGLDDCRPRLYRHDMESFVWVLAYITVAYIEYKGDTIKISPLPNVDAWFRDEHEADRSAHVWSKRLLHSDYGRKQRVSGRYGRYINTVRQMTRYLYQFHEDVRAKEYEGHPLQPNPIPFWEDQVPKMAEVDDPAYSLKLFITMVEASLGEGGVGDGFAEVNTLLLEAINTPIVMGRAVNVESV